jgi:DNA polymerase (family X)
MPMNDEVAAQFDEIAERMLLKGESWFKVRAYREGAAALRAAAEPIERLNARAELAQLPHVGKAIAEKTAGFLQTGSIPLLERLRAEAPAGLLTLLRAGMAPSLVRRARDQFAIDGPQSLRDALDSGRLEADHKLRAAARAALHAVAD